MLLKAPHVGLMPTLLFGPAGTCPDPAVAVSNANGTMLRAATDAEPELAPEIYAELNVLVGMP